MDWDTLLEGMDEAARAKVQEAYTTGIETAKQGVVDKNKDLLKEIKDLKKKQLPDGVTKDDLTALAEHKAAVKAEEERLALERGEFDKVKSSINASWQDKYDNRESELLNQVRGIEDKLQGYITKEAARSAFAEAKLQDYAEVLMPHVLPHIKAVPDENGNYQAKVWDGNANAVAMTELGAERGIKDVIASIQSNPAFAAVFKSEGSGANGSGVTKGGENPFSTGNMTEQAKLMNSNPTLAREMAKSAGVVLPQA